MLDKRLHKIAVSSENTIPFSKFMPIANTTERIPKGGKIPDGIEVD